MPPSEGEGGEDGELGGHHLHHLNLPSDLPAAQRRLSLGSALSSSQPRTHRLRSFALHGKRLVRVGVDVGSSSTGCFPPPSKNISFGTQNLCVQAKNIIQILLKIVGSFHLFNVSLFRSDLTVFKEEVSIYL